MEGIYEKRGRFDELRLSAKVFLANKTAVVGLFIFILFVAAASLVQFAPGSLGIAHPDDFVPPGFTLENPLCVGAPPEPPSATNLLGTTSAGGAQGIGCIALLQAVLKAIRVDLAISFFVVLVGAVIGTVLGVLSAYAGGLVDEALMRVTDVFFTVPFLVLALAVSYVTGRSLLNMALALIVVWWPLYARYSRSLTISTKESAFVEAARAAGSRRLKIDFRHIMPNVLPPVFIQISLDVGTVIAVFAALGFIGLLPSNANLPELGYITNQGLTLAPLGYWWTVIFPGAAITLFSLAVNLMGDGFRDVINPRRRS